MQKQGRIALIRSGQTAGGKAGRLLGVLDEALSMEGKEHLEQYREEHVYPPVSLVYSGRGMRCRETALLLYPRIPVIVFSDLRPFDYGEFAGKTREELADEPVFEQWARAEGVPPCPGGDSAYAYNLHSEQVFRDIVRESCKKDLESVAVIADQTSIAAIMTRFCVPRTACCDWEVPWGRGFLLAYHWQPLTVRLLSSI